MAHFQSFAFKITPVELRGFGLDGNLFHYADAIAFQADDFLWVVGDQPHFFDSQVRQHLGLHQKEPLLLNNQPLLPNLLEQLEQLPAEELPAVKWPVFLL